MAGLSRHVHLASNFEFGSIDDIAPDLQLRWQEETSNGGDPGDPVVPRALWFVDADGETHVYPLSDDGRQKLVSKLTGGVVLPPA